MKLIFSRQEDTIVTKLELGGDIEEFDYLIFINKLIGGETLEEAEYPEDITQQEKEEIDGMIDRINEALVSQSVDEQEELNIHEA